MARTLDVYLYRHLAGHLIQNEHGEMVFDYAESWLKNPAAMPLSHSLPLRKERFERKACRGFFGGILPEENKRRIIAANLGISAQNDFAMLEKIGGECAGAVTFLPAGDTLPEHDDHYRVLSNAELAEILRRLPRRPLLAGDDGIRLSLAGAQDKLAVHLAQEQISIPLGNAPSTHILKPAIEHFSGVVFNEALCLRLAAAIGLPTAKAQIGEVEGIDYLLVERYDRTVISDPATRRDSLKREHQEDFCQALGIVSENKYQNEGGPSLSHSFALLREVSSTPAVDLQSLLDVIIFNFLIGNNDAHGKNFSFLYTGETATDRQIHLAKKMAMKIGGEYVSDEVRPKHFERLAEEAGLTKSPVLRRVPELAELILAKLPEVATGHPVTIAVGELMQRRCEWTMKNFKH
jgi:serine/threonine-protein kinase HipA